MTTKPLIAAALALGEVITPAASAQSGGHAGPRYEQSYRRDYQWQESRRGDEPRRYAGRDERRCGGDPTGTILGALAGGLVGRSIDAHGDRAASASAGAGAGGGALAGRVIERSNNHGYCR